MKHCRIVHVLHDSLLTNLCVEYGFIPACKGCNIAFRQDFDLTLREHYNAGVKNFIFPMGAVALTVGSVPRMSFYITPFSLFVEIKLT